MSASWGQLVDVRPFDPARPGERAFVVKSWTLSWSRHARPPLEPARAAPIVEDHLDRCDQVLMATVPGVERTLCGFVARLAPGVIAYLYVAHDYRRRGIAERLLHAAGIDPRGGRWRYAFSTPRLRQLCRPDPKRPDREPWRGAHDDGKTNDRRTAPRPRQQARARWPWTR